ncbi:hypothetical protein PhaeoP72_03994 (plasmid) [Phaeobacter inhibens]|uniref:DUF3995 domain-containing protein n=1 Tax=Phaeobacter inhibens TaxID=221822 RepID=UPI000C9BA950|nr:DUF3995 domain-containing protein [Phaeobacter inhibens]AUR05912.1 hypothetical protein PhaeoP72_03994 [Phaeobacter inhibens]
MTLLALITAAVLWPIAGLHMLWAFGNPWPFKSEDDLAKSVGGPSLDHNIGFAAKFIITVIAAGAIWGAGLLPLMQIGVLPSPFGEVILFWLLVLQTAVFLIRGALGYVDLVPASAYEPFRTNNRRYFSPLIISLGLACAAILIFSVET